MGVVVVGGGAVGAVAGFATERYGLPRAGLLAAGAGWLVVMLAAFPAAGQGLLGLADGVTTPVLWALVFVAYWMAWELAWDRPAGGSPVDTGRRRLVLGVGLGSLALLGVLKVPDWVRAVVTPPESGLSGPVPELTPVDHFYKVSKNFQDPVVRATGWSLRV